MEGTCIGAGKKRSKKINSGEGAGEGRELPRGDCFADSTPLGFNTTRIPHFKTPKKISKLRAVGIRP